jgi:tetratricopeptide (TPR) repeat protein
LNIIPDRHPRAYLWLAKEAIREQDQYQAEYMISSYEGGFSPEILSLQGDIYYLAGDLPSALNLWKEALNFNAIKTAAAHADDVGDLANAKLAYETLYNANNELGTSLYAEYLWQTFNEPDNAELIIRESLDQYPGSSQYSSWLRILGNLLIDQNKWEESEVVYKIMLSLNQNSVEAYRGLSKVSYARGDGIELALSYLFDALPIEPTDANLYYDIAMLYRMESDFEQAAKWFDEALKRKPDSIWWQIDQTNNYRDNEDYDKALELYLGINNNNPDWPVVYYELAWLYLLIKDQDGAIESIEAALDLMNPESYWYYLRAGVIYEWADERVKALVYYKKALTLNPEQQDVLDAINRLSD